MYRYLYTSDSFHKNWQLPDPISSLITYLQYTADPQWTAN